MNGASSLRLFGETFDDFKRSAWPALIGDVLEGSFLFGKTRVEYKINCLYDIFVIKWCTLPSAFAFYASHFFSLRNARTFSSSGIQRCVHSV